MDEPKKSGLTISKIGFDNVLLVFVAILFVVSVVSSFQLNELNGKIISFEKLEASNSAVLSGNSSNAISANSDNAKQTDQEILDKLNSAPDMVGGC